MLLLLLDTSLEGVLSGLVVNKANIFLVCYRPAGCLVVPGPGLIHALAGMANAAVNCW